MNTYQQIREQLINLSVDLEDKSKVCKILEQKVRGERDQLGLIESKYEEKYQLIIKSEVSGNQEQADKLAEDTNKLIERKKDLVESCRILIDELKEKEGEAAITARKVFNDIESSIDQEKRLFRSGHEERLQKYLVSKAGEVRDATSKAMSGDLKRIDLSHEQEMLDLERKFKGEERRLREALRSKLAETVESEERAIREAGKRSLKNRGEAIESELQKQEREHRQRLRELGADDDAEAEALRVQASIQGANERQRLEEEITRCQEEWRGKLRDAERANANELIAMQKDQNEQLKKMRVRAAEERRELEQRIRTQVEVEVEEDCEPDSRSNSIRGQGRGQGGGQERGEGEGGGRPSSRGGESKMGDRVRSGPVDCDADFNLLAERDKRIQSEIRQLQLETVKMERLLRAKNEEEKAQSVCARNKELEVFQRKQRAFTEEMSSCVLEKEQLLLDLKEQNSRNSRSSESLREIRREIETYRGAIDTVNLKAKELEGRIDRQTNTRKQNIQQKEREMLDALKGILREDEIAEIACQEELKSLERERDTRLDELDREIKSDMSAKDLELEELQHLVHTEKTKTARLQTLIKKRSNSSISTQDPDLGLRVESGPSGDRNRGKVNITGVAQEVSPVHRKFTVEAAIHPRSSGNGGGSSTGASGRRNNGFNSGSDNANNGGGNSSRGLVSARDRGAK